MRFTVTTEGAERLGLNVDKVCYLPGTEPDGTRRPREFNGPSLREGLLAGVPRGILAWAKKALKVQRIDQLDLIDQRLLYYVITMRGVDHTLLPIERFDDLAVADFELVQHAVTFLDRDGDCGECSTPVDNPIHIDGEDTGDLPPTTGPGGPEMTGTATS
jgi:hypothetical protein